MRKVTASAVILTALTGCSQSGVPDTQWSYQVPPEAKVGGRDLDVTASESAGDPSFTSSLSPEAQSYLQQATAQSSATESGATDGVSALSDIDRIAAGDFSSLLSVSPLGSTQTAGGARPDPLTEARAFIRQNSPSAITARVPYNAQAYLPASPLSLPISSSNPIAPASVTTPTNVAALSPVEVPAFTASAPVAPASPTPVALSGLPSTAIALPPVAADTQVSPSAITPANVASTHSDGLPTLEPAQTSADVAGTLPSSADRAARLDSDVPLGTAILRDIERDETSAIEVGSSALASSSAQSVESATVLDAVPSEAAVSNVAAPEADISIEITPTAEGAVASPLSLSGLLSTMPDRPAAPIVSRYRQTGYLEQATTTPDVSAPSIAFSSAPADGSIPYVQDSYEGNNPTPSIEILLEGETVAPQPQQLLPDVSSAADQTESPLLESLRSSLEAPIPTAYVPIAEESATDWSAEFIQAAIDDLTSNGGWFQPSLDMPQGERLAMLEGASLAAITDEVTELNANLTQNELELLAQLIARTGGTVEGIEAQLTSLSELKQSERGANSPTAALVKAQNIQRQRIIWQ